MDAIPRASRRVCWSWPLLQRQNKRKVCLDRCHGETPMFVLRITGPREGSCPTVILTQQDFRVRLNREQDAPQRLPPEVAPSDICIAILVESFQRRAINLRIRGHTMSPLMLRLLLLPKRLSSRPCKIRSRRNGRSGRALSSWPYAPARPRGQRRSILNVSAIVPAQNLSSPPRIRWGRLGHRRFSPLVDWSSCRSAAFRMRRKRLGTLLFKTSALKTGSSFLRV